MRIEQLLKTRKKLQEKYGNLEVGSNSNRVVSSPEEKFVLQVSKVIEKNLHKDTFNGSDLSREVHLSKSQLYRKLKAISGKSTAVFIRTVRLKKAKELLLSTTLNISEIAYAVGFKDPAWFSRVFREEFGIAPTEFRKGGELP